MRRLGGLLFPSLHSYPRNAVRSDLLAGLTVWAILIPEALAYASIAGVSPVVGLYAAPGALILYAAFGSSRHVITGPMAATAALSAATVGEFVAGSSGEFTQMTVVLAICVGVAALVAGLLRLGFLASFISEPVLKGFIVGLALTIIIGQVPKLFGVEVGDGDFFEKALDLLGELGSADALTLAVGAGSLGLVLGLRRVSPSVPGSLVAVAVGIAAVELLDLQKEGLDIVGSVEGGLPSLGVPDAPLSDYGDLAAGAIGVMLVGFAESLGAGKTYAARYGYEIDANRELVGLGAANLGAGLSSGMVVNGSLSKTAVNASAGARTQLSGLIVAVLTVVTLLFLTGLFESLPEATLAAVVIAALIELVDVPALAALYRVYARGLGRALGRPDFIAALAAMAGVLIFDTLPGLFIGIGISLLLLLYRASRPHIALLGRVPGDKGQWGDVHRHPANQQVAGIRVLRVEGGLFFANADAVRDRVRAEAQGQGVTAVILDAETMPFVDVSAVRMLTSLASDLERDGKRLLIARDIGQVRDVMRTEEGVSALDDVYPTVDAALAAARDRGATGP